jgi:hypothetical protein
MVNSATPERYHDVIDRLEGDGVRYVIVGGVAVVLHGHVRPIVDLDIVIDPTPREADRALDTLARCGFVPSIPLPLAMVSVMRMFDRRQREVDVNVRYHIPFAELWAAAQRIPAGGVGAPRVACLDHLLRAKRITARPHDLQDIDGLLRVVGGQHGA